MSNAGALAALGANELNLAGIDGSLNLDDSAFFALSHGLLVLGCDVNAFNNDLHSLGVGNQDLALLALVLAGQNDDFIVFLDSLLCVLF